MTQTSLPTPSPELEALRALAGLADSVVSMGYRAARTMGWQVQVDSIPNVGLGSTLDRAVDCLFEQLICRADIPTAAGTVVWDFETSMWVQVQAVAA